MTYQALLTILNARGMFRIRPSLDRMSRVLKVLGDPQTQWPAIHIAGTNGKGSVAAGIEAVLRTSGYQTGFYTSPHLVDLRERIQVNGQPISHQNFAKRAEEVLAAEKKARAPLTYFELLTAIAFQTFAKKKVNIAVVECGLGGLWDATNLLPNPLISLITSIGLDHQEWLGRSERQIALQKAGIIKPQGYVISGVRGAGLIPILRTVSEKAATLAQLDRDFSAEGLTASWRTGTQTLRFQFKGEKSEIVPFGLLGAHQVDNAALVMTAVRRLKESGWFIPTARRDQALKEIYWPGRLHLIQRRDSAPILLDGAHNPHALKNALQAIKSSPFEKLKKTFIFSSFKDKDYKSMARLLRGVAAQVFVCSLGGTRGASLTQLRSAFASAGIPTRVFPTPQKALSEALEITPSNGLVMVTGSLALVGAMLSILKQKEPQHA